MPLPSSLMPLPMLLAAAYALQPPGSFHGDEPVARDGEAWLALERQAEGATLVASTIRVRAVADPVLDAADGRSGRDVGAVDARVQQAIDAGRVVAFLRGPGLRAGPVVRATEPAAAAEAGTASPYPALALRLAGIRYRLTTRCDERVLRQVEGQTRHLCAMVLATGARSQTLSTLEGYREAAGGAIALGDDANPQLLFAGDLDHDGQLDLILDTTDHYNLSRPSLFLSSQAAPGALVAPAAQYESVGC